MKKFILLVLFLPVLVYSKTNNDSVVNVQISKIKQRLTDIEKSNFESQIEYLNQRLQDNENLVERSFDSISTQLSVSELFVGRVSVILAVLGLFLGWHITKKYNQVNKISQQVKKLKSDNEDLLERATVAKEEVEKIYSDINHNISNVYEKIKREETVSMLDRLVNVPQDISNIITLLLSRTLESTDFEKIKTAYLKLNSLNYSSDLLHDPETSYQILFFQHFFVQSIKDKEISTDIIAFIPEGINCAFENDIENTTKEFSTLLNNENISAYRNIVIEYFKGLSNSKFKDYKKVYEIFFEILEHRGKQFELFDTIVSNQKTRIAKIEYGLLLKNKYPQVELSENERKLLVELEKLKDEYKNETIAI